MNVRHKNSRQTRWQTAGDWIELVPVLAIVFWRIDIRNKEQSSKLLLLLLILDSFPAISEDFKSFFAFKRITQKPTARKRALINYNFKFNIRLFSSYWKYELNIFFRMFRTRANFLDPQQFTRDTRRLDYLHKTSRPCGKLPCVVIWCEFEGMSLLTCQQPLSEGSKTNWLSEASREIKNFARESRYV